MRVNIVMAEEKCIYLCMYYMQIDSWITQNHVNK